MSVPSKSRRNTPQKLISKKRQGEKIVSLTAYDYGTAKQIDQTGMVDFLLVGDSLGMVMLGHPDTLSVTMDEMLHHAKAVSRGVAQAMVVVDMPFMSIHVDLESGVRNAARMIQEAHVDAVKVEGASSLTLSLVRHLTEIGVPVMGHLGFTPQSIHTLGGFKVQGKTLETVRNLVSDAMALEAAGAFAVVLEMVPLEVAQIVTRVLSVPTIGIGAGAGCDGQILVVDDFMGKFPDFKPKFARSYMRFADLLQAAVKQYAIDIVSGDFPNPQQEAFHFPEDLMTLLRKYEHEITPVMEPEHAPYPQYS